MVPPIEPETEIHTARYSPEPKATRVAYWLPGCATETGASIACSAPAPGDSPETSLDHAGADPEGSEARHAARATAARSTRDRPCTVRRLYLSAGRHWRLSRRRG